MSAACSAMRNRQRGLAAVEMALVTPILLLLLMAVAELGHAFYEYNTLTKAVRNGARYLVAYAPSGAGVINISEQERTATCNLVVYGNTAGSGAPLLADFAREDVAIAAVDSRHFRITATYRYRPVFAAIPGFGHGDGVTAPGTLVAAYTMRAL